MFVAARMVVVKGIELCKASSALLARKPGMGGGTLLLACKYIYFESGFDPLVVPF